MKTMNLYAKKLRMRGLDEPMVTELVLAKYEERYVSLLRRGE